MRLVSIVPSLTETIAYLGGGDKLVGITRFCKYPQGIRNGKVLVGGTKGVDIQQVEGLKPDVILAVKEENNRKEVLALAEKFPIVVFDIYDLGDVFQMNEILGMLLGEEVNARKLNEEICRAFSKLKTFSFPNTMYLIWKNPWMAAGVNTFINNMMIRVGFENITRERYPQISENELAKANILLLSSEPYPFSEKHKQALQSKYPEKRILLVDGELFSWYGSRLLKAVNYFRDLQKALMG